MPHLAFISIIIPVLNEEQQINALLHSLTALPEIAEIIVVDGGSTDMTVRLARAHPAVQIIECGCASRALQMNAGAALARAEVLLFLHADVRLPVEALKVIQRALINETTLGGCFEFSFPSDLGWAWRLYAWGINWRTRRFQTATGDQAIFVRRQTFASLGGYPAMPLMEDIALFKAVKRLGKVIVLPQRVRVSPRRWQQHGLVRTGLLMYALRFGYWLGISPALLKRYFLDVR